MSTGTLNSHSTRCKHSPNHQCFIKPERASKADLENARWAINLGKLDGVQEIYRRELENWLGSGDEESDSQSDDEESDLDEDEDEGVPLPILTSSTEIKEQSIPQTPTTETAPEGPEAVIPDERPQPRPFETLRDFFTRTSTVWQDIILEKIREDGPIEQSVKELRKVAFEMSERKWWDSREEVTALEDEQEQAGIGDVVNLADRSIEAGGGSRRR